MDTERANPAQLTATLLTQQPHQARLTIPADTELTEGAKVVVRSGRHAIVVDEPRQLGGSGIGPSPGQYALAALGACVALTYRLWSDRLGIGFERVVVDVRGDIDLRGLFGLDQSTRPGFSDIRIAVRLSGGESDERYDELRRMVDTHCPILDTFRHGVHIATTVTSR